MSHHQPSESIAPRVSCIVLDTGYCTASEHHLMRNGRHAKILCHAIVALLHHPQHGWTLWDTGYAPRLLDATSRLPWSLYRRITPLVVRDDLAVVAQLPRLGLAPRDIKRVILSHFHADHIAGLRDFPHADLIASADAYADVAPRQGIDALRRAFIPTLLPPDFAERAHLLPPFSGPDIAPLGATHDLFGDGTVRLVALPGHAKGQIGLLARTTSGELFFAADGCWMREAVRRQQPPHPITALFVDDYGAVATTIQRLHQFTVAHPSIRLVPSHCPEAFSEFVGASGLQPYHTLPE